MANVFYFQFSVPIFFDTHQCVVAWLSQGLCITRGLVHATQVCHCVNINQPSLHLVLPGEGLDSGQTGIQKEHIKSPVNSENMKTQTQTHKNIQNI